MLLLEAVARMKGSPGHGPPTLVASSVARSKDRGRVQRNSADLFKCAACGKMQPWTCTGLSAAPSPLLPLPCCNSCLEARGLSPAACAMAALGRRMAEAFVQELGCAVTVTDPDGWCLLTCVVTAAPQRRAVRLCCSELLRPLPRYATERLEDGNAWR